ncbi:Transcriptional regulator [Coemansia spiralis]|uniref:Transcriptional regulator n=2 Tax=Coemansia TaxID=4863 RepID=A0A9W8L1S7_9FUNG|nr:Transcriptional regulator [Coemansia spiralis]
MPTFAQFATTEVQKSALVSQFISTYELSSRKALPSSELRQLQEELERMSARATARVSQLEQGQSYLRGRLSEGSNGGGSDERAGAKRDRDAVKLDDSPMLLSMAAGPADAVAVAAAPQTATSARPSTDKPANKRAKSSLPASRVGGSESDNSAQTSSKMGGDGKYFQARSEDHSPAPPPKVRHSTGTPVQDDFSRVKVANQVPNHVFWASLEPYFRSVTEDDLAFLESRPDSQESYAMPRLGKFYARVWAEEEISHFPDHMNNNKTRYAAKHLLSSEEPPRSRPATASFSGTDLVDSDLSYNSVRLAPLTERLISALVAERLVMNGESWGAHSKHDATSNGIVSGHHDEGNSANDSGSEDGDDGMEPRQLSSTGDLISLEDRLKRELRYIGILDDDDVDWDDREDDEVCVTMRSLQRQLREQTRVNAQRKERLLSIAKEHTGYQEYTQVIDELDKQVEQSYLKRHRLTKSRKRKSAPIKTVALSDNAISAMDRRRRVTQAIGHLFPAEKFGLPAETVFSGIPDNPEIEMQ